MNRISAWSSGIRPRIILVFFLCFGLMAGISLMLLHRSLNQSYDEIERRELDSNMGRIVQSLDAALGNLKSQTRDWAEWTEMYRYALKPDAAWVRENIGVHAMEPANLSLVMVFGADGRLLTMTTRGRTGAPLDLSALPASPYANAWKSPVDSECGLVPTPAGLLMHCWARIVRSDGSGDFVGSVVMGRLLDQPAIEALREQIRLPFELRDIRELPPELKRVSGTLKPGALGGGDYWAAQSDTMYHLYYRLQDRLNQDIALLTLDVSRDVHAEGEKLFRQIRWQLIWAALATAALLSVAVHFMVVRRLRRLTKQLSRFAERSDWHERIDVTGRDELGTVAEKANALLTVIESQVATLEAMTLTDPMTGLANRRAFDSRLTVEYGRSRRNQQSLALIMLDVDHFKLYNDHYGHPEGDAALQAVAEVLKVSVRRAGDLPARLGGEEFAVLMPDTDANGALAMANRIRTILTMRQVPHDASPVAPYMTVSIGIALAGDESPAALIERADQALYRAKKTGRNRAWCDGVDPAQEKDG